MNSCARAYTVWVSDLKKTVFIKNAAILTATSFLLRFAGILFKVWLAALIGPAGIGLYQLIFSVHLLVSTAVCAGIDTAVTRLIAEITPDSGRSAAAVLRNAVLLTLSVSLFALAAVFFGAEWIAAVFLNDVRAIPALRILPFSLPFMGVSACLRGAFVARRNITPNALSQLLEQAVRIGLVFGLVRAVHHLGLAACCAAVVAGDTAAEGFAFLLILLFWRMERKRLPHTSGRGGHLRQMLHISLPIASGRTLNTALRTAENVLMPKNLAKFSADSAAGLAQFGMIKGMALPVLFFPSTLLGAVSTLLVPEISEAAARGRKGLVKAAAHDTLKLTAVISFLFAALFFAAGKEIGQLIYQSEEVGFLLHALAPIVPLMYLDSISDGLLKGLDQQGFSFRTAVSDSALRILLILLLVPVLGMRGFLLIMYFSNLLTCFLNVGRLMRVSGAKMKIGTEILLPLFSAVAVTLLCDTALRRIPLLPLPVYLVLLAGICLPVYFLLLVLFGSVTREEARLLFRKP